MYLVWLLFGSSILAAAAVNPADVDINGDLTIDIGDAAGYFDAWLTHDGPSDDWNPACDISLPPDGVIDLLDLQRLIVDWGVVTPEPNAFINPADFNGDFVIDVGDVIVFSAAWLGSDRPTANWNAACDIADPNDGLINSRDFAVLAAQWQMMVPNPNDYADLPDIDADGAVNLADYAILSAAWRSDNQPDPRWNWRCDVTDPNDGSIDGADFALMAKNWQFAIPDPNLFAFIGGGEFEMGDHTNKLHASSRPVHTVRLDSFYMGRYEVTFEHYGAFLNSAIQSGDIKVDTYAGYYPAVFFADDDDNSHPLVLIYSYPYEQNSQFDYTGGVFTIRMKEGVDEPVAMNDHPVLVNWYGAAGYCNWLSVQDGREACYDTVTWACDVAAGGYRLPTEAEWEYAARGGLEGKLYPWGNTIDGSMANFVNSGDPFEDPNTRVDFPYSTPVGFYDGGQIPAGADMANGYGLYDMAGNAFEWCNDWFGETYYQACENVGTVTNPTGPQTGTSRSMRGGSWNTETKHSNVAYRDDKHEPHLFSGSYGFRISIPAP